MSTIPAPVNATIDSVVRTLKKSRSILFITGAGISAESGLGTYRGQNGLYNGKPTEEGYQIEEIMSASMLAENPALTWKYLVDRIHDCLLYTSPSPRDATLSRMPSSA